MVEPELNQPSVPGGPPPAPEILPAGWAWSAPPDGGPTSSGPRWRRVVIALVAIVAAAALVVHLFPAPLGPGPDRTSAASAGTVTVLAGEPASIDPAHHGDLGSAQFVSQLFETLTAVDPNLDIRPALAASWQVSGNGTKVTFTLRPNLQFSDGSPLTANDVVHSWRRLFSPADPSPLASLIGDVKGAKELLSGQSSDTSTLGVSAPDDTTVVVDMVQGGGNLPAIVSGAPFAVVPSSVDDGEFAPKPGMVGSGAYTYASASSSGDTWVLKANPHYWAGKPAIDTVNMLLTLNGASPVDEFSAGTMDVAPISFTDAGWLAYDRELGPSLREDPNLSVTYYGFETRKGPFANVKLRQAFAAAIDWRRLAKLQDPLNSVPATGMVPAGMPGQPQGDFIPAFDVAKARQLLADAGYPNGQGLPTITFIGGGGGGSDSQIVAMIKANLGVTVQYQTMDFQAYQERLATDPPDIWSISWVADYPGPNDFLGVLLGTGSTANQGGWSNADFDAAVAQGSSASDPATALAAYTKAEQIIADQVPVVPVTYGRGWSLVRSGLLGAAQNGTGILRLAGLQWSGQ
ncbi:MAG: peptide ABC transporter substrate-binding protein [Chloroflexota bacterium]